MLTERPKDPRRIAVGRRAARKRWGPQRIVRLDQLDADTARLVRALLAQVPHKEAVPVIETPGPADAEGHGNDRSAA